MKKHLVQLTDRVSFYQDQLRNEVVQNLLRTFYVSKQIHRAKCLCNPEKKLDLVIAYRRKENFFELRKMPGQNPDYHNLTCRFRKKYNPPLGSFSKELTIAIPKTNEVGITDSQNIRKIIEQLWSQLENEFISKGQILTWKQVKGYLKTISQTLRINKDPLSKNLTVIIPKSKDYFTTMNFKQGKIVIAELLYASQLEDKTLIINLKGAKNPIWYSHQRVGELSDEVIKTLLKRVNELANPQARRVVIFTAINSNTGKSIQANSIHVIGVDKRNFIKQRLKE